MEAFKVRIGRADGTYSDGMIELTPKLQRIVLRYGQSMEVGRIIYFSFITNSEYTLSNSRRIFHLSLSVTDSKTPLQSDKVELEFLNSEDLQNIIVLLRQSGISSSSSRNDSICMSFDLPIDGCSDPIPSLIRYKDNNYNVKAVITLRGIEFRSMDTDKMIVEIRREIVQSYDLSLDERSIHVSLSTGREFDIFSARDGIHKIMSTLSSSDFEVNNLIGGYNNNNNNNFNNNRFNKNTSFFGPSMDYSLSMNASIVGQDNNNNNNSNNNNGNNIIQPQQNQEVHNSLQSSIQFPPSNNLFESPLKQRPQQYQQQESREQEVWNERNLIDPRNISGGGDNILNQDSPRKIFLNSYLSTPELRSSSFSRGRPLPRYMQQTESSTRKARSGSALREMVVGLSNSMRASSREKLNSSMSFSSPSIVDNGKMLNRSHLVNPGINNNNNNNNNNFDTSQYNRTQKGVNGLEVPDGNTTRNNMTMQRTSSLMSSPQIQRAVNTRDETYTLVLNLPSGDVVRLPFTIRQIEKANGQLVVTWRSTPGLDDTRGYGMFSIE